MAINRIYLFLYTILFFQIFVNGNLQVTTKQGTVVGKTETTIKNRIFYSFTGIPYAKPPIGLYRFEPPEVHEKWDNIYNATVTHSVCPQFATGSTTEVVGDENCLFLNIYTPKLPNVDEHGLLPVMFYIHGGAFIENSAKPEFLGPKILLDKNIVLVTVNYRLGPLGFFSTGDSVVPGNLGLKDQAFALRWVKNNILNFGGNPNKITVFGHSAGAGAAHLQVISPLSKDLIQSVIVQSGSALSRWIPMALEDGRDNSKSLANIVGCQAKNSVDMVKCLKDVRYTDIIKALNLLKIEKPQFVYHFFPIVEPDNENAFLTEHPLKIIKSGRAANVPFMTGVTSEDGSIIAAGLFKDKLAIRQLNNNLDFILPPLLFYNPHLSEKTKMNMNKAVKEFYLDNETIDFSKIDQFIKMCGDATFLDGVHRSITVHSKYSTQSVFYYLFAYRGSQTYAKDYNVNYDFGVTHADELLYLFNNDMDFPNYAPTESDTKIIELLTTLWTNFAHYGHPTPKDHNSINLYWKPVEQYKENYYHIRRDGTVSCEVGLLTERAKFWANLPDTPKIRHEL